MSSHKVGIPATMQAKIEGLASASETPQPAAAKPSAPAATSRPVHPAVFSTFGPGKGGGCSEFSVWAYLTRPRPSASLDNDGHEIMTDAPLPNLVTAHSNALRVYTVLPHGGTLALTAVYDNLAGTICSLDVIPHGTGGGDNNASTSSESRISVDDYLDDELDVGGNCSYDGLLIGFAGHPRLSLVYPSTPMVGGGYWDSSKNTEESNADGVVDVTAKHAADDEEDSSNEEEFNYGVGQGGVLLASSIIDLTPALMEKSMGGTSFLEQDMIVSVSTNSTIASGVDVKSNKGYNDDPSVSVVLGGGVAIASFSLPKSHRPGEGDSASPSWWRVASEPYVLPLTYLASKIRSDFGGSNLSAAAAPVVKGKNQPNVVGHTGSVGHGFGEVLDIAFLSGYTEPVLCILHSNPKRGGGRQWVGRMGRTEEIPVAGSAVEKKLGDDVMDIEETKATPETTATGTKYGLTLSAVSLAINQHRSVVLWSLTDAIPADSWNLIPHPSNGVVVLGVNAILYVSMGGKITSALAVNGFAKISCPVGLIPPSKSSSMSRNFNSVHLEANPSPLPLLALQLDGARVGFVSESVAIVCLGNGSLLSLQLHSGGTRTFMSLSPMGHRVGGLGVASCLSIMTKKFHSRSVHRYLNHNSMDISKMGTTKEEDNTSDSKDQSLSGPNVATKGMFFVGSRMGDCTLLAFEMNEPTCLIVTDVDSLENRSGKRKSDSLNPDTANSTSEPTQKQLKLEEVDTLENEGEQTLTEEDILRLEEEELYRDDSVIADTTAPSLVSPSRTDIDASDANDDNDVTTLLSGRKTVQSLTTFRTITALDSLTGLGPLGPGCYGPVATFPHSTGQDEALSSQSSLFSNTFASSARHMIMPCGFGDSGGLAVLTTPGRDTIGGTILCEADLLGMEGTIFSLPTNNLILMGKSDSSGALILRGVRSPNGEGLQPIEEFEEVDVNELSQNLANEEDSSVPSLHNVEDVMKMKLYAVSEFGRGNSLFLVKTSQGDDGIPYSIIIMSSGCHDESKDEMSSDVKLSVSHVHRITFNALLDEGSPRSLSSVTPIVSDDASSISFGCVWSCGHASLFDVRVTDDEFEVVESIFFGDMPSSTEDTEFYKSNKIVAMDLVVLPDHIFACDDTETSVAAHDESTSLSFPPDRLSMHGSWMSRLDGNSSKSTDKTVIVLCRRSGALEMYNKDDAVNCPQINNPSNANTDIVPIWKTEGCGHGVSVLGQLHNKTASRKPEGLVETAEIRVFVSGPSLSEELSDTATGKDAWMLRSLCVLVDTSLGDLQLYSGSKRKSNGSRLEFLRVPLNCVTRPSEEAGRHFVKLRRKGIVPDAVKTDFRSNRLHRFSNISQQSGLFAATPRPLWFVSERGAPAVVSHKSRHVSAAGARQVPVSGFCSEMPCVFQSAKTGFISMHERIGRVGSQRITLFNGLLDVFSPRGLLPGGGVCIHKYPLGVTVRQIEFIDDASISSPSRPIYAMLISREVETKQTELNDDGISPEERQQIKAEKEAAHIRKQVEADLGGFDIEQEWVEEIERDECFEIDKRLGHAPSMPTHKFEVWLVDASSGWAILDKYELDDLEYGTALKVLYLTDVIEDSDEIPKYLFVAVGTGIIEYDGEDFASKGKLMLFQPRKVKSKAGKTSPIELVKRSEKDITIGPITYLASLHSEDIYRVVVGAGAEVTVEQWGSKKLSIDSNERQLSQVGFYHAHMQVLQLTIFKTFFLLSDGYDSMHFLVWRESDKSLTLLAKDFEPCEVFAGGLISRGGAMSFVCHDDRENLQFFQYAPGDAAARGGNKLVCRADYHLGSQTTSFQSHWAQSSLLFNSCTATSTLASLKQQDSLFGKLDDDQRFAVNFGTTDGSFCSIVPLSEPTYWRLTALQSVMSNALESNCALSHRSWRLYRRSTRRGGCKSGDRKKGVIDADLVTKFVDLPLPEQEDLASSIGSTVALIMDNLLELGCAAQPI